MSKSYTYIKCDDCARRGTPKCRNKGERWSSAVVPGCMVKIEDVGSFLKPKPKTDAGATTMRNCEKYDSPVDEIASICDEMRDEAARADMEDYYTLNDAAESMRGYANRLGQQHKRLGMAILDFCNAFTLVYPPNDPDCPAILAGAFDAFKEAMGIETVGIKEEGAEQ